MNEATVEIGAAAERLTHIEHPALGVAARGAHRYRCEQCGL
jgi:hypothetical protein